MQVTKAHIKLLKQGHTTTQKLVFEKCFGAMFRVCQRYVIQIDEAEDCVMKGFLKAFQQIEKFEYQNDNSFMYWLKRIMVNEALMALRKQNNFSLVSIDNAPDIGFDDDFMKQMDAQYLFDAILKLPIGYRTVLNMFIVEGYSHQEIAQTLGITESTSKTQLAKAKAKLKNLINPKLYGYGNA
ncbi:MAG: sigma-70 family RNA polymerase sigma factor [Bacteroidia bacterium]|nr:sigma-70 family RNA polymerase sigma factor [Bacteroidia bacterium]